MATNSPGMQMSGAFRVRRSDGSLLWVDATATTTSDPTGRRLVVARVRDVDREHRAKQRLQRSEESFRTAMNASPVGMALLDTSGRLLQVNESLCRLLHSSAPVLTNGTLSDLSVDRDDGNAGWTVVMRGDQDVWVGESELHAAEAGSIWVQLALAAVIDDDGQRSSVVAQFIDVSQAREARALLEFQANHDPLTGLKNRRAVMAGMATTLAHRPRSGPRMAVLYCDLDGFKPVNDTYGHAVGDQVLTEVGRRVRRSARVGDTVARIGGDEFVVLLMQIDGQAQAVEIAEGIRSSVSEPMSVGDVTLEVTISIGLTMTTPGEEPDDVLAKADQALYAAKTTGRNRVVPFGG